MRLRQFLLILLPIILFIGPALFGWLTILYCKKFRARKLMAIGIMIGITLIAAGLLLATKNLNFQQLLKVSLLFVLLWVPAFCGMIAAIGIQKLPARIHLAVVVILIILAIATSIRWAVKFEDGWGPFLIGWPLSGVLVFAIESYLIKRKGLTKSATDGK